MLNLKGTVSMLGGNDIRDEIPAEMLTWQMSVQLAGASVAVYFEDIVDGTHISISIGADIIEWPVDDIRARGEAPDIVSTYRQATAARRDSERGFLCLKPKSGNLALNWNSGSKPLSTATAPRQPAPAKKFRRAP